MKFKFYSIYIYRIFLTILTLLNWTFLLKQVSDHSFYYKTNLQTIFCFILNIFLRCNKSVTLWNNFRVENQVVDFVLSQLLLMFLYIALMFRRIKYELIVEPATPTCTTYKKNNNFSILQRESFQQKFLKMHTSKNKRSQIYWKFINNFQFDWTCYYSNVYFYYIHKNYY